MKSYSMQATNDSAVIELKDVPMPEPGPTQLLVKIHAASLNRGEFILGHGLQKPGSVEAHRHGRRGRGREGRTPA